LGDFTCFILVPAIRDLSDDAAEGRGSAITALVDIVARNVLAAQKDFRDLEAEMQDRYGKLIAPSQEKDLSTLAKELGATLQTIAPDAGVHLEWLPPPPVAFPMPKVDVKLSEDGQPFSIAGTGHGLQRAFIVTLLQHLAMAQRKRAEIEAAAPGDSPATIPNIILAIEEPELYQHPTRQRHLARLLLSLSQGKAKGLADTTQIMYATHCPLFVGIDRFDEVRIITKSPRDGDKPRFSQIAFKTLDNIATVLQGIEGGALGTFTAASVQARLATILTPWLSEGFFADVLVLVEGPSDRAALMGVAEMLGYDFDQLGIAILPCDSKSKLFTSAAIFRAFDLPIFCAWDGDAHLGPTQGNCPTCKKALDKKPNPIENRRIMRLLGKTDEEWPNFIDDDGACFEHCLEHTLEQELGEDVYRRLMLEVTEAFGYNKLDHAKKNPSVVAEVMRRAQKEGAKSVSLERIVQAAYKMRRPSISMEVQLAAPAVQDKGGALSEAAPAA
jgi:putative ATP-dependent endonuclease of OLD family